MSPNRNIADERRRPFGVAAALVLWQMAASLAPAQNATNNIAAPTNQVVTNINAALPHQVVSTNTPPLPPGQFNPDPGNPPFRTNLAVPEKIYRINRITNSGPPPLPPAVFNPDPGAMLRPATNPPLSFFTNEIPLAAGGAGPGLAAAPGLAAHQCLWRGAGIRCSRQRGPITGWSRCRPVWPCRAPTPGPTNIIQRKWDYANYPVDQGYSIPPFSEPATNRWRIGFVPWRRYTSGDIETPYETPDAAALGPLPAEPAQGRLAHHRTGYFSRLDGRFRDGFRGAQPADAQRRERGAAEQRGVFWPERPGFCAELFFLHGGFVRGRHGFPAGPLAGAPAAGLQHQLHLDAGERRQISPNPTRGTARTDDFLALQEAFVEIHLGDMSDNYDFIASRVWQPALQQRLPRFHLQRRQFRRAPFRQRRRQPLAIQPRPL